MLRDAQSDAIGQKLNNEANRNLAAEARLRGLSIVPVVGAGQAEGKNGNLTVNREESSTVQPVGEIVDLEARLASLLGREACAGYPIGWAAGYGVSAGLVRKSDAIVMDALSHNWLREGARHATRRVLKFAHDDLEDFDEKFRVERSAHSDGGLFIVVESLHSMESDIPDLVEVVRIAHRSGGRLIVSIAHDFRTSVANLRLLASRDIPHSPPRPSWSVNHDGV